VAVPARTAKEADWAKDALAGVLAAHDDVEACWYWGSPEGRAAVERASAGNMKRTWCHVGPVQWSMLTDVRPALREATQVKNIWVPYGE